MPKLTLSIDIGPNKQKFDFPAEFVDAATQFIATQSVPQTQQDGSTINVPKYPDVQALLVSHIEALGDTLLDMFPQKAGATAQAALITAKQTIETEKGKYRKATKL